MPGKISNLIKLLSADIYKNLDLLKIIEKFAYKKTRKINLYFDKNKINWFQINSYNDWMIIVIFLIYYVFVLKKIFILMIFYFIQNKN